MGILPSFIWQIAIHDSDFDEETSVISQNITLILMLVYTSREKI